jgi:hypothetical protein
MRGNSRLIAVFLFFPFLAAMFGTQALASPTMPPEHPAGCHSHGPAVPTHTPVSYQCCVMGHHWVMPGTTYSAGRSFANVQRSMADFLLAAVALSKYETVVVFPSASPPEIIPLRI